MDLKINGKTALVTGASTGIGRAIAKLLAAEGVRLAIAARRRALLETLAGEIVAAGGHAPVIIEQDVLVEGAPDRVASAAIEGLGSVQILINNAGGAGRFRWRRPRRNGPKRSRSISRGRASLRTASSIR